MPLEILAEHSHRSLSNMLRVLSRPADEAIDRARGGWRDPVLRLRASLPDQARPRRRLPRAIQRRRRAARPARLRGGAGLRSDREEAVLPRPARLRRADLRHARLRFSLRLLPELGHQPDAPRSRRRRAAEADHAEATRRSRDPARRAGRRVELQRAAHHQRVGGRRVQGSHASAGCAAPTSPTATARRRCSISSGRTSTRTRSTSRRSATKQLPPARRRAGERHRRRSACSRNAASGSRSSRSSSPASATIADDLKRMAEFLASRRSAHALAHDGVSSRLQDDRRLSPHDGRRPDADRRVSAGRRG